MAHGYNKYIPVCNFNCKKDFMIHAEIDCLNKLKTNKEKRIKKIDLFVVRVLLRGTLSISKPCRQCLFRMQKICKIKRYHISNIYYSDQNGNIIGSTINKLLSEELWLSSSDKYKRKIEEK